MGNHTVILYDATYITHGRIHLSGKGGPSWRFVTMKREVPIGGFKRACPLPIRCILKGRVPFPFVVY